MIYKILSQFLHPNVHPICKGSVEIHILSQSSTDIKSFKPQCYIYREFLSACCRCRICTQTVLVFSPIASPSVMVVILPEASIN